jgi:alcohol dehydrogenase class IV
MGNNVLLVTGSNTERAKPLIEQIPRGISISVYTVNSEPTAADITNGVEFGKLKGCKVVIGFGGGSAIDCAKAIAALIPNDGELFDYLEVIGKGKPLTKPPLPFIAIPTTAGTGAEVTKNSVIKSPAHHVKVSLRNELMYPDFAVVDPSLTLSLPPEITASTGVDALTHLLETFVSNQSNPFIDMFCREGMNRISQSLRNAYNNGDNLKAREDMSMASMLGGMALANVKLGAVHGFAGPMGGMFSMPHGAICACLLPAVMEINIKVISEQNLQKYLQKYDERAKILTGNPDAEAGDGIKWVKKLVADLAIPSLSDFGLQKESFPELVVKAKKASSMKGNSVVLDDASLIEILEYSL